MERKRKGIVRCARAGVLSQAEVVDHGVFCGSLAHANEGQKHVRAGVPLQYKDVYYEIRCIVLVWILLCDGLKSLAGKGFVRMVLYASMSEVRVQSLGTAF